MKTKTSTILAGIIALVIAGSLLAVNMYVGTPNQSGNVSNPATSNTSQSTSKSTSSVAGVQQGTLSILLTDPPNVPDGVTKVYISYSNLAVHVSEAGNQSGWTQVKSQGSIELMGTVNFSQTISSVKIKSGDYNLIRFNISSAQVTYNGKNYTAFVQSSSLQVPIIGGIEVNASKPSATIIDISPTVLNIGSASNPEFVIRSVAKALPVPSSAVNEQTEKEGSKMDLRGNAWWKDVRQRFTANAQVTAASITANSLSLTLKNTGSQASALRIVTVSPLASTLKGERRSNMPSVFFDSAIFIVNKNGTLVPLSNFVQSLSSRESKNTHLDNNELTKQMYGAPGFSLAPGSSATLTYNGQITLGFLTKNALSNTVVKGQQYLITVLGEESLASMVVVAG